MILVARSGHQEKKLVWSPGVRQLHGGNYMNMPVPVRKYVINVDCKPYLNYLKAQFKVHKNVDHFNNRRFCFLLCINVSKGIRYFQDLCFPYLCMHVPENLNLVSKLKQFLM